MREWMGMEKPMYITGLHMARPSEIKGIGPSICEGYYSATVNIFGNPDRTCPMQFTIADLAPFINVYPHE